MPTLKTSAFFLRKMEIVHIKLLWRLNAGSTGLRILYVVSLCGDSDPSDQQWVLGVAVVVEYSALGVVVVVSVLPLGEAVVAEQSSQVAVVSDDYIRLVPDNAVDVDNRDNNHHYRYKRRCQHIRHVHNMGRHSRNHNSLRKRIQSA